MATWIKFNPTQLLIGLGLVALPVFYFVYAGVSWSPLNPYEHLVQNTLAYVLLVLFSIINHTVFVPRLFLAKRYRQYAFIAISCVLVAVYLPYRVEQWVFFKPPKEPTLTAWFYQIFVAEMMLEQPTFALEPDRFPPSQDPLFKPNGASPSVPGWPPSHTRPMGPMGHLLLPVKLALFFLLGSVSTLLSVLVQTASRLRQVENDRLQAEVRELKAQIQPHFLFNTLNSIYALAIRNDERTADTVVKLSEFMRYNIRDAHRGRVPLSHELAYIGNYIDLQKARLRDAVQVDYLVEGLPNGLQIAPLLLFSFIENAFKYGVSPEEESPITIHLTLQEHNLQLLVANRKVQTSELEKSTGIGLQNARQRLRLLYPSAHQLLIDDTTTEFRITLSMSL
ncbi:histidine kinase [Spirosoma oryzae]|uniref:Histidine kinase n=1 Tax=Spirosoma oryzae TaxID=1469603 RepID=A0A2T0SAJ1_9BACT|nr:sensor histidine kinase [Spirosoma oryzae]PRY30401.1 histidine kinase [Spirosoma oryzae]